MLSSAERRRAQGCGGQLFGGESAGHGKRLADVQAGGVRRRCHSAARVRSAVRVEPAWLPQSRNPRSQLVVSEISPGERADGQDIRAGLAAAVHHHRMWDRPRAVQRGPEGMEVIEDIAGRVREATGLVQRRAGEGQLRPGRHGVRLRDERRLGRLRAGRSGGVRRLHRRRGAGTNSAAEAGGISGDQARAGARTGRGLAQGRRIRALGAGPDREW